MNHDLTIDLTLNADPVYVDIVTERQLNCRFMNDISNGALNIKESHRLRNGKEIAEIRLENYQLQELMATITNDIDTLHQLSVTWKISPDSINLIQSYLFQNGCIARFKGLQNKEYLLLKSCKNNLLNDLIKRHKEDNYTFKYEYKRVFSSKYLFTRPQFTCQIIKNKFYINNSSYSEHFVSDLYWLKTRIEMFHDIRYFLHEL
jgi:hypothetical protein